MSITRLRCPNGCGFPVAWCKCKEIAVHARHCCTEHGCKYGEIDCPVVTKLTKQLYPCMDCEEDKIPNKD